MDRKRESRQPRSEGGNSGKAVLAKYGPEFFRQIGRKGGQAIKDRGLDYRREIGRNGGETTKARHGRQHFSEIGRKGGQAGRGTPKPGAGRHKSSR